MHINKLLSIKNIFKLFCYISITIILAGCGFHLRGYRGDYSLPFKTVYIQCDNAIVCTNVSNIITNDNLSKILPSSSKADAIIKIFGEETSRDPQGFNSIGRISSYLLTYQVNVSLLVNGEPVGDVMTVRSSATMQYNDSLILSANQNEVTFWQNLHEDVANKIIRQVMQKSKAYNMSNKNTPTQNDNNKQTSSGK